MFGVHTGSHLFLFLVLSQAVHTLPMKTDFKKASHAYTENLYDSCHILTSRGAINCGCWEEVGPIWSCGGGVGKEQKHTGGEEKTQWYAQLEFWGIQGHGGLGGNETDTRSHRQRHIHMRTHTHTHTGYNEVHTVNLYKQWNEGGETRRRWSQFLVGPTKTNTSKNQKQPDRRGR